MRLKAIVESLDGLSDEVKQLYKQAGDVFVLDIEGVDSHPTVSGLSNTVKSIRTEKKDLEKELKKLKAQVSGVDFDKIKDIDVDGYADQIAELEKLRQEKQDQKTKKLEDEKNWEKLKQQLIDQHHTNINDLTSTHTTEIESLQKALDEANKTKDQEIDTPFSSLKSSIREKDLTRELAVVKGNIPVLMPHLERLTDIKKNDKTGKYDSFVVDENGEERLNNLGQPMSIKELVGEFKEKTEFSSLFGDPEQSGGSGSHGNRGDQSGMVNPFAKDTFNLTEQARLKINNPQLYDTLKAAVGKE